MRKRFGIVFNLGISGEDIVGIADRFEMDIRNRIGRRKRDMFIIIAVGVNDSQVDLTTNEYRTELSVYKEKLQQMVIHARDNGSRILLVGLAPIDDTRLDPIPWHNTHAYRKQEVKKYNDAIQEVGKTNDVPFVSLKNIFGEEPSKYLIDGIHPNAEGHRLIYERVKAALEKESVL
jgi:lysophospholipase L1-like esterase